ncbi:MAG: GNAT family N-acetyltransferase [Rudaea sp.]
MSAGEFVYERLSGAQIATHIDDLARLRIDVFREFPYLYDGDEAYERNYLQTYVDSPRSIVTLVYDDEELVGATTGLPMADETDEFRRAFDQAGYAVPTIFYCGESVLKNTHRGRGIYKHLFQAREENARALGGFDIATFCCVQRPANHPLRPASYVPLNDIWTRFGYTEHPELETEYSWKDIDESSATPKRMRFWMKDLHAK